MEAVEVDWVCWGTRHGGGSAKEVAGDWAQRCRGPVAASQSGVGRWAWRRREEQRSKHRGTRTGRVDRVARLAACAAVSEGRHPSGRLNCIISNV